MYNFGEVYLTSNKGWKDVDNFQNAKAEYRPALVTQPSQKTSTAISMIPGSTKNYLHSIFKPKYPLLPKKSQTNNDGFFILNYEEPIKPSFLIHKIGILDYRDIEQLRKII